MLKAFFFLIPPHLDLGERKSRVWELVCKKLKKKKTNLQLLLRSSKIEQGWIGSVRRQRSNAVRWDALCGAVTPSRGELTDWLTDWLDLSVRSLTHYRVLCTTGLSSLNHLPKYFANSCQQVYASPPPATLLFAQFVTSRINPRTVCEQAWSIMFRDFYKTRVLWGIVWKISRILANISRKVR